MRFSLYRSTGATHTSLLHVRSEALSLDICVKVNGDRHSQKVAICKEPW